MAKLTIASVEMLERTNVILSKNGYNLSKAYITDFARTLGGKGYGASPFAEVNNSLLLGTYFAVDSYGYSVVIDENGFVKSIPQCFETTVGVRPAILLNDLEKEKLKGKETFVYYESYPMSAVDETISKELNYRYLSSNLIYKGKTFYIPEGKGILASVPLSIYEYNGSKYICVPFNTNLGNKQCLTNGLIYDKGDSVWIKVEMIPWIVDAANGYMLSEKILFSGLNFNETKVQANLFDGSAIRRLEESNIDKFLQNSFLPNVDLVSDDVVSKVYVKQ
ncbi:MAG: hypothetical protein PHD02_04255 [Bacilli bacterium]|nr:hypothetical protein [Bacilli bacterium]